MPNTEDAIHNHIDKSFSEVGGGSECLARRGKATVQPSISDLRQRCIEREIRIESTYQIWRAATSTLHRSPQWNWLSRLSKNNLK